MKRYVSHIRYCIDCPLCQQSNESSDYTGNCGHKKVQSKDSQTDATFIENIRREIPGWCPLEDIK